MMGLVKFLQKRPSDMTIRVMRIVVGLLLVSSAYYSFFYSVPAREIQDSVMWQDLSENGKEYIKYVIVAIGLIPLFVGITGLCLFKSKYMRITQIGLAILIFYASSLFTDSPELGTDTLFVLLGLFPLTLGITGKCITQKCLRHGEKITKIRV